MAGRDYRDRLPASDEQRPNTAAYRILERDLTRVCAYFVRQGAKADAPRLLDDLWRRYGPTDDASEGML